MHPSLFLVPLVVGQALWLLGPGLLAGLLLAGRGRIPAYLVVPVAALIGCVAGYGVLWAFFGAHWLGNAAVGVFAAAAAGSLALIVARRRLRSALLGLDVLGPLLLLGLLTVGYCSLTFSCTVPTTVDNPNAFCHLWGFTGDNYLPLIFADNVHHGDPRALTWGWQGSDRPPLQSGAVLLQAPLTESAGWRLISYQVLGVLLQALWLPVLWALCRALRMSLRALAVTAAMCVCTGFFTFNTVFAWPKLLPAALVGLACVVFFFEPRSPWSWVIGGLAAGAAMTAHSGVVFTLLPVGVALLLPRYRPSWAGLGLALLAALALFAPWQAYQKLYDPPGDRLLKWHLAGVEEPDERPLGTLLRDQYGQLSPGDLANHKFTNLTTLVGAPNVRYRLLGTDPTGVLRYEEFRYLIAALGLFNLGWLALVTRAGRRRVTLSADLSRLRLLFAIVGTSLLAWVLLMFGPATTLLHQGSYATMLLLFAACGALVAALPRWLARAAVTVQALYWVTVWAVAVWRPHHLHLGYVVLTALTGAAMAAALLLLPRLDREPAAPTPAEPAAQPDSPALPATP